MLKHTTPFHNRVKSSIFFKPVGGVKIATCQMVAKNAKMDFMELFFDKVCVKKKAKVRYKTISINIAHSKRGIFH